MNMPFELGIDFGLRLHTKSRLRHKEFLILDEKPYRYQAALSDLAGFDIRKHGNDEKSASQMVTAWLCGKAGVQEVPPSQIWLRYQTSFLEWHYERQLSLGASDEDIQSYPVPLMLKAMLLWVKTGKPNSFD